MVITSPFPTGDPTKFSTHNLIEFTYYFLSETEKYGLIDVENSMGADVSDLNGDGQFDLFVTNIENNRLNISNENGTYVDGHGAGS